MKLVITINEREVVKYMVFVARYINMDTNQSIFRKIEFNGRYFCVNEKEAYLYAMSRAYDMKRKEERLEYVKFIEG